MKMNAKAMPTNPKNALLVVLSPMPKLGDGVLSLRDNNGLIRTFEPGDPRLKGTWKNVPITGDRGEVLDLLTRQRRVITTVEAMKIICRVRYQDFAEPDKYKPRAKPTRKTKSITQMMAEMRKAG